MPQTMTKTVTDACESWLKTCERNQFERSTLKAYRSHARVHIEPKIGPVALADLSRGQVRDFMDELLDDGISQALVRKVMISLRAVLSEALDRDWIEHNVATNVKMLRRRRTERRTCCPDEE